MWNSAGDSADTAPEDLFPADDDPRNSTGEKTPDAGHGSPDEGDDGAPIVAELAVEHPDLVLADAIRAVPSVTVEPNYRTSDETSPVLVFVAVGDELGEFETALETDHTVSDPHQIRVTDDARAYRTRYAAAALRFTPVFAALGALVYDSRTDGRRWLFDVLFPSRAAFAGFRKYCSANSVTLNLFRLSQGRETAVEGELGLTAQQWKTLTIAHEMGYFDVPRGTTQEELAERLDVSPSAVSQRIRRATNQLLAATLESSQFRRRF